MTISATKRVLENWYMTKCLRYIENSFHTLLNIRNFYLQFTQVSFTYLSDISFLRLNGKSNDPLTNLVLQSGSDVVAKSMSCQKSKSKCR
jgi:hypothetical protein